MPGRRPEDTRLSDAFRVAYEAAGVPQTQIAAALPGIDQPTVSKWARGERPPPLWTLPIIDGLCRKPAGHILRLAGFVSDDISIETAIEADPRLDESGRELVGMAYRYCVSVSKPVDDIAALDDDLAQVERDLGITGPPGDGNGEPVDVDDRPA